MSADLRCANCNQHLGPSDKFCRECGLPTVHRAEAQRLSTAAPPSADDFKRAMGDASDPAPMGPESDQPASTVAAAAELTTGSVVKVTNPTFAAQMGGTTLLMVGLIVVLGVIGIALIVLSLRFWRGPFRGVQSLKYASR